MPSSLLVDLLHLSVGERKLIGFESLQLGRIIAIFGSIWWCYLLFFIRSTHPLSALSSPHFPITGAQILQFQTKSNLTIGSMVWCKLWANISLKSGLPTHSRKKATTMTNCANLTRQIVTMFVGSLVFLVLNLPRRHHDQLAFKCSLIHNMTPEWLPNSSSYPHIRDKIGTVFTVIFF